MDTARGTENKRTQYEGGTEEIDLKIVAPEFLFSMRDTGRCFLNRGQF
jgi:hypothetical protein